MLVDRKRDLSRDPKSLSSQRFTTNESTISLAFGTPLAVLRPLQFTPDRPQGGASEIMTRQAAYEPNHPSAPQMNQHDDLGGNCLPTTGRELSFSLWLDEQLGDLERRWSHFGTNHWIAAPIDR